MDDSGWVEDPIGCQKFEEGILFIRHNRGVRVTLELARKRAAITMELLGERVPVPTLVDLEGVKGFSPEVRRYFSRDEEIIGLVSRLAALVNSPVARVLGNTMVNLFKTQYPVKLFTDREQALEWLREGV